MLMVKIDCPHEDAVEVRRVCRHLVADSDDNLEPGWQFTGIGREYNIICGECAKNLPDLEANLLTVCRECFGGEHFFFVVGQPEILKRNIGLGFTEDTIHIPSLIHESFLDIQPIASETSSSWLAFTATYKLVKINLDEQTATVLDIPSAQPEIVFTEKVALRLSFDSRFVAIVNEFGIDGLVVDLVTNQITMYLKRDDYYPEHCPFPIAFFRRDEQSLVVHATRWNRLDISDPRTGQLLTERNPTSYQRGESRPEHYLDYFHTSLVVSPDSQYVAEDGWVWHPIGVVVTWSLEKWLNENVWESEDGQSLRGLCDRGYFWNGSLCWLSNSILVVWGQGTDDDCLISAARLFDVATGREIRWFPGPEGKFEFDTFLFSFSEKHGLSAWDVETGEQLFHDPDLTPIRYNHHTKQFLTILPYGKFKVSRISSEDRN